MAIDADRLPNEALQLPPGARANLAEKLFDSLDDSPDEGDATPFWAEEIERRLRELDDGTVKGIPLAEARQQIFESNDESEAG